MSHRGKLAASAIVEAIGMYTAVEVIDGAAKNSLVTYVVEATATKTTISCMVNAETTPQQWQKIGALHYCLLVSLFKSRIGVTYHGRGEEVLPGRGRLNWASNDAVGFVHPFQDHLPQQQRAASILPKTLAEIYEAFRATNSTVELIAGGQFSHALGGAPPKGSWQVLKHSSGLQIQVTLGERGHIHSHAILGYTPALAMAESPSVPKEITAIRTWGEAWVKHDDPRKTILSSLVILPDEIGIYTDSLYRYRVADNESLLRISNLDFGEGASTAYRCSDFMDFAMRYLAINNAKMAIACFEQATLLQPTSDEQLTIERWNARLMQLAQPLRPVLQESFTQLRRILGEEASAKFAQVLAEREEAFQYSDFGRIPMSIQGVTYVKATDEEFYRRGLTASTLAKLCGEQVVTSLIPQEAELFHFTAGDYKIWGTNSRNCYVVEGHDDIVFGDFDA